MLITPSRLRLHLHPKPDTIRTLCGLPKTTIDLTHLRVSSSITQTIPLTLFFLILVVLRPARVETAAAALVAPRFLSERRARLDRRPNAYRRRSFAIPSWDAATELLQKIYQTNALGSSAKSSGLLPISRARSTLASGETTYIMKQRKIITSLSMHLH